MKLNINNLNTILLYDNSYDRLKKVYLKKVTLIYNKHFLIISSKENFSNELKSSCWIDSYKDKELIFFNTQTSKRLGNFVNSKNILFSNTYLDDFRFFEQSPVFDLKRSSLKPFSKTVLKLTPSYKKATIHKPKKGGFVVCWQGLFGLFPKTQMYTLEHINGPRFNRNPKTFFFTHLKSYLQIKKLKRNQLQNTIKLNNIYIFNFQFLLMDLLLKNKKRLYDHDLKYKYVS